MTREVAPPTATASVEAHADWLELLALSVDDQNSSLTDLMRMLRGAGTIEEVVDDLDGDENPAADYVDSSNERLEAIAEDAASELSDRALACGTGGYPFRLGAQDVQAADEAASSVYVFLLLLSTFGVSAGPPGFVATQLFEDVAAAAAQVYFGGPARDAELYQFGFPRRREPRGFRPALDELCRQLGEGRGARGRPTVRDQKDSKLDLVVWRPFPDQRAGKLIGFGQCAAGADWQEKISELHATTFIKQWMMDTVVVDPIRMFFCPFRIDADSWVIRAIAAGVLFDRCRIAHLLCEPDSELAELCSRFSSHVLSELGTSGA